MSYYIIRDRLAHPSTKWNFWLLSDDPNIPLEHIEDHIDAHWSWESISRYNKHITIPFIRKYIHKNWRWRSLTVNPNITPHDIFTNPDLPWEYSVMSFNPNVTAQDVIDHPEIPWNWRFLAMMLPVSVEFIVQRPEFQRDRFLMTCYLSQNKHITIDDALKYTHLPWDWVALSSHSTITIQHVKDNPTLSWSFYSLGNNPAISANDILSTPQFPWEKYAHLLAKQDVTIEMIQEFYDATKNGPEPPAYQQPNWHTISSLPICTIDVIVQNPHIPWKFAALSKNPAIRLEDMLRFPDLPWDWEYNVSLNPNVTFDFVMEHPEIPWNWDLLSHTFNRTLLFGSREDILHALQLNICARKIQRGWFRSMTNPEYRLCRARLLRDFDDLVKQ